MKIESGTGNGYQAAVDDENRLRVASVTLPRQHAVAKQNQKSFQLIGEATPTNGTTNVLHIANNTNDQAYTLTYVRLNQIDVAGGTALPNASNYFEICTGLSYSSGGSVTSAVNTFTSSNISDGGAHYDGNPTLTGNAEVLDKHYPKDEAEEQRYSKEGSVIIPPGSSLTIRFVGDNTAGSLYARISYYVSNINSLDV